jgi:hypothetical protein
MDEQRLRELVIRAIELIKAENIQNADIPKKKLYVLLTEEWNGRYWSFFEKLNEQNEYEAYAVISSKVSNNIHLNNLKKFQVCKEIIDEKDIQFDKLTEYTTVFPIVPREIVAKTALCIDDIFETKWIFRCMEEGQRIIFLKSGLQKFSGKEPVSYTNKILNYYRTLLEYNIEILDYVVQREDDKFVQDCRSTPKAQYSTRNDENLTGDKRISTKKVITEKELDSYIENNQIILNSGDIITDMACDKARSLKISIIRK